MPNKKIKNAIICIKNLLSKYSESINFIKFKLLNAFRAQTCFSLFYSQFMPIFSTEKFSCFSDSF